MSFLVHFNKRASEGNYWQSEKNRITVENNEEFVDNSNLHMLANVCDFVSQLNEEKEENLFNLLLWNEKKIKKRNKKITSVYISDFDLQTTTNDDDDDGDKICCRRKERAIKKPMTKTEPKQELVTAVQPKRQKVPKDDENRKEDREKKRRNIIIDSSVVFDEMPTVLKNRIEEEMGGYNIQLVIQKSLFSTDVNRSQGRFSIPLNQIRTQFLTEEENRILNSRAEIRVTMIEPCGEVGEINLKKWVMKSSSNYVLVTNWNKVVLRNELVKDMVVQLWSFRIHSRLCFALLVVVQQDDDPASTVSNSKAGCLSSHAKEQQINGTN